MRKQVAVIAAFAVVIVLVASTAIAGHGSLPWVPGSGVKVVLVPGIEGPEQLAPDEPFHIHHGWGELDVAKEKQAKDFSFTVRAITGEDVNNQSVVGTFLEPTLTNCDPNPPGGPEDRDCKLFLFDFPGGLQTVPGYDGGPVRFVADWYGPCGQVAAILDNAECTLDEDQVVAVLHGELIVNGEEEPEEEPSLQVGFPSGTLNGNNFVPSSGGFDYLVDGDPSVDPATWIWIPWAGMSFFEGSTDVGEVIPSMEIGDHVGIRNLAAEQEVTWQVIELTLDSYTGTMASGKATELEDGTFLEFCVVDEEGEGHCDDEEAVVLSGMWTWTGDQDPALNPVVRYHEGDSSQHYILEG